jgi:FAD synthase
VEEAHFSFFSNVHIIDDQNVSNSKNNDIIKDDNVEQNKKQLENNEKRDNRVKPLAQTQSFYPPPANNNYLKTDYSHEGTFFFTVEILSGISLHSVYVRSLSVHLSIFCRIPTRKRTFGKVTSTTN